MDNIDLKIIDILKDDGRISHESLAKKINLSRPATRSRILALEQKNIITGYTTEIDYSKLGYPIQVVIYLRLSDTTYKSAIAKIKAVYMNGILRYSQYRLSGDWSILLKVMARTQQDLSIYLDILKEIDGISATNTVFLFDE